MEYPGIVMIGDGYRREVVHETAHQWWYGTVGNDEMDQPWLDEGLTVYSTEHYLINKGEDSLYVRHSTHFREIGIPVLTSSIHFPSIDEYFEVIYKKGSGILWMLEGLLGEELMQEVMREYYLSYKFENVGVQDFVATVNRVAESDFDWFFDQWLTTTKKLDFSVTSVSQEMSPYTNSSYLHRFRVNRVGGAIMPVRIEITLNVKGRKKRIYRQWDGKGSWKEFFIRAEGRLESIVVDPHKIILEENRANNHWYSTI